MLVLEQQRAGPGSVRCGVVADYKSPLLWHVGLLLAGLFTIAVVTTAVLQHRCEPVLAGERMLTSINVVSMRGLGGTTSGHEK